MSAPRLLIDNDVLKLLSCSGLLDDAINVLGFDRPSTFHLGTLPYMLDGKPSLQVLSSSQKDLIRANCRELPVIAEQPSVEIQTTLTRVRRIDEGEVVLFGIAADNPTYLITSGDKAAMHALATTPSLQPIRQSLAGRVISLETVCLELMASQGVPKIAAAVAPVFPLNISLKTYFGAFEQSGEASCYDAIHHYLARLNSELGAGFLWSR